nr:RNA-dependent RNA polymerase [Hubei narna-like virus 3]
MVAQRRKAPLQPDSGWFPRQISRIFGAYWGPTRVEERLLREWEAARTEGIVDDPCTETDSLGNWFRIAFERALHMADAYWECLSFFDEKNFDMSRKTYVQFVGKLFSFGLIGEMESYLKFETATLLAICQESETPPPPEYLSWNHIPGTLFLGGLHRKIWMRARHRRRRQDQSLFYSLYRVKDVAHPLLDYKVRRVLARNRELLTDETLHPLAASDLDPPINSGFDDRLSEMEWQVRRTVREVHSLARRSGWRFHRRTPLPTTHASLMYSRKRGGAFCELLGKDPVSVLGEPFLVGVLDYRGNRQEYIYTQSDPEEVKHSMETLSRTLDYIGVRSEPILEPFKVRVVSCGDAAPYQLARRYQKGLWEMLACTDTFRLVGSPFTEHDVEQCCLVPRLTGIHSVMVSGDYDAATDRLHPHLAQSAMDEFCRLERVPFEDRVLLQRSLTGHVWKDGERQCWGQLMGSFLSFPILNLCNAAETRAVMEDAYEMYIPLEWSPLKVNGDDILFCLPPAAYPEWSRRMAQAGLIPSMGKNYVSRRYAMINSQMYELPKDWDRAFRGEMPRLVPSLKLGLIRGPSSPIQTRKGLSEWLRSPESPWSPYALGDQMRVAALGFDRDMASKIYSSSLRYALPLLQQLPPVSWFSHPSKGGLGLPTNRDPEDLIREHHRRIAAFLTCHNFTSSRDEQIRHSMRMSGSPLFASTAIAAVQDSCDRLGIPYKKNLILLDKEECRIESLLLSDFLWGGSKTQGALEADVDREGDWIRDWTKSYWKWTRLAETVVRPGALLPMTAANCLLPWEYRWERDFSGVIYT